MMMYWSNPNISIRSKEAGVQASQSKRPSDLHVSIPRDLDMEELSEWWQADGFIVDTVVTDEASDGFS